MNPVPPTTTTDLFSCSWEFESPPCTLSAILDLYITKPCTDCSSMDTCNPSKETPPSSPSSHPPTTTPTTVCFSQTLQLTQPGCELTFSQSYSYAIDLPSQTPPCATSSSPASPSNSPLPTSEPTSCNSPSSTKASPSCNTSPTTPTSSIYFHEYNYPSSSPTQSFSTNTPPVTYHLLRPDTLSHLFPLPRSSPSAFSTIQLHSHNQSSTRISPPCTHSHKSLSSPASPRSAARVARTPRSQRRAQPAPLSPPSPRLHRQNNYSNDFQSTVVTLVRKHRRNAQWHAFRKLRACTVARGPCVKGYMKFCQIMGTEFGIEDFAALRDDQQFRNLGSRTECRCPYTSC